MYSKLSLPRREIRLLRLEPGSWREAIECYLHTVSLDKYPRFKALSYVWGDPQQKKLIVVNGRRFWVTKNLAEALQRLRDPGRTLIIWVDALCINQKDLSERGEQVRLMGDIYSSAEEVLIWLGYGAKSQAPNVLPEIYHLAGDDTDSQLLSAYFRDYEIREDSNDCFEDTLGAFVFMRLCADGKHLNEMSFFRCDGERLQAGNSWAAVIRALDTFVSVSWWKRIWALQEGVLARKARIYYRNITAPWDFFVRVNEKTVTHDEFCCGYLLSTRPMKEIEIILKLQLTVYKDIEVLRRMREEDLHISLAKVMSWTFQREATDVRDKVYGLLGLVTTSHGALPLLPYYRLNPREIFIQASFHGIKEAPDLRALMGTHRTEVPNLPSWVRQSSSSERWMYNQEIRVARVELFNASGNTVPFVERERDSLLVTGYEPTDTVKCVGPTLTPNSWEDMIETIKSWKTLAELDKKKDQIYTEDQTWEKAWWRTIINDCIAADVSENHERLQIHSSNICKVFRRLRDKDIPRIPEAWWRWFQSQSSEMAKNIDKGYSDREIQAPGEGKNQSSESDSNGVRLFQNAFLNATVFRRFFITTGGRMGIGPETVLPGDFITILAGGRTPFALRSIGNEDIYNATLVGDVYVHGIMHGEGLPENWDTDSINISIT